jgi:16S rRNA (guanine966-N2)-methyltransferase
MSQSRIIAGSRRGRRIAMPPGARTRPTSDRVREALFSAIAAWAGSAAGPPEDSLAGLAFCDLYAGSGAVGLEAASRGANPVVLVERDSRTAQLTKSNVRALGLTVDIVTESVEHVLRRPPARAFDVVFADPPYELETDTVNAQLEQLVANRWVGPGSLIVVERSRRTPELVWPAMVAERWSRGYGETLLCFGSLEPDSGDPARIAESELRLAERANGNGES